MPAPSKVSDVFSSASAIPDGAYNSFNGLVAPVFALTDSVLASSILICL